MKKNYESEYLTREEIVNIIEDSLEPYSTMFLIMAITGKRVSEMLALRVKDIDFKTNSIEFNILKRRTGHRVKKTYESKLLFSKIKNLIGEDRLNSNDYIFPGNGKLGHITRIAVYQYLRNNFNAHPHQFRHSVGYALAKATRDAAHIQKFLDHARITSTEKYIHIAGKVQKEMSREVTQALGLED